LSDNGVFAIAESEEDLTRAAANSTEPAASIFARNEDSAAIPISPVDTASILAPPAASSTELMSHPASDVPSILPVANDNSADNNGAPSPLHASAASAIDAEPAADSSVDESPSSPGPILGHAVNAAAVNRYCCAVTYKSQHLRCIILSLILFFSSENSALTSVEDASSSSDFSMDAASSALAHTASCPVAEPVAVPAAMPQFAVPPLNLAAAALAAHGDEAPLLARNHRGREDGEQDGAVEEEAEPRQILPLVGSEDDHYSDDDDCNDDEESAPSEVALRALEVFSLLFSQIDYSLIDGFAYVSNDLPSVSLEHLLAFCRQYLNNALSEDDVRDLFREMDSDCDGMVSSSDWGAYFNRIAAARDIHGAIIHAAVSDGAATAPAVEQLVGAGASTIASSDAHVRSAVLASAAASGVELQESDISEELLATLQQLQQELVLGAAHALHLHSASSQQVPSSDLSPSHAP
jgi:hypothetical protein